MRDLRRPVFSPAWTWAPLLAATLVAAACGRETIPTAPAEQRQAEGSTPAGSIAGDLQSSAQGKVAICHRTEGTRGFIPISVAEPALPAHLAHGDGRVGDLVPGQPGMRFGPGCVTVSARRTLSISGSWDGRTYWMSVFTVASAGPVDAAATVTGFSGPMHLYLLGYYPGAPAGNTCGMPPVPLPSGPTMDAPAITAHWNAVPPGTYCVNVTPVGLPGFPAPYTWAGTITYPG